jgi:molecular chaperone HtpG
MNAKNTNHNNTNASANASSHVNPQEEKLSYQAEVAQLLHLVTHSLYSNKEIFLRELVSNASDAADKLRFAALADDALYEGDSKLWIRVAFDKKERTITVRDNGIGMSREEVVTNLGTIAKSGTREFLAALAEDKAKDMNLIGQFGVGFYSSFVVARKVVVRTRRAGMRVDQGVCWESTAGGEYTVKNIEQTWRGTEVTLYLKQEENEFLDDWRLRHIITKYSDHIILPIYMAKIKSEAAAEVSGGQQDNSVDGATTAAEDSGEEVVNRATALWALPKKDIKDDDYKELYKHITHDFADPLLWSHNVVEGKLEYITLLYIPEHAPFDLWQREHKSGLKLYVQRVFIMDNADQLLPNYLRFVRGVVDSKDLPLNVSREILQNNKIMDGMRAGIVKRVLDMLEKLALEDKDRYAKLWAAFGQVLKEGMVEDFTHKERIAKLLRFASTHGESGDNHSASAETIAAQGVSLDDYVGRMRKGQDKIYYITADSFMAAKNSPHLEIFKQKGIEVLLFVDRIDEWMLSGLNEYLGKQLQSVAKGELDLSKIEAAGGLQDSAGAADEVGAAAAAAAAKDASHDKIKNNPAAESVVGSAGEEKAVAAAGMESVLKQMQQVLGEKVKEVRLSARLTDSPTCLVAGEHDMSMHLQRLMMAAGQPIPRGKPTLEINVGHPLVQRLKEESDDHKFAELTTLLFEQALLAEGGHLDDPATFVKRMNALLLDQN